MPGGFESNPWLQHLGKLQPAVLLIMAKQLDEFVNTGAQAGEDKPELSGHALTNTTCSEPQVSVAGRLGAYFVPVNNLMWTTVFLLGRPLSVFLLERPESADYEDMYETFYILTGCHEGAKYFIDIFHNMDRLLVVGAPKQKWEF